MIVTFLRWHLVPAVKMVSIFHKVDCYTCSVYLLQETCFFIHSDLLLISWIMSSQTGFSVAILLEMKHKPLPKTVFKLTVCFLCTFDNMKKRRLQCGWLINTILGSFGSFCPGSNQKPAQLDSKGVFGPNFQQPMG